MAKFTAMKPDEVLIGRQQAAAEARKPFVEALKGADAGKIELDRGEKPATVKRYLTEAAGQLGVRVRSSWEDPKQPRVLFWRKTKR